MTSVDGKNWTLGTDSVAANGVWYSMAYNNNTFVAVGSGTYQYQVMTSKDGVTWVNRTPAQSGSWAGITYGNGLFVAVAYENYVMTSPDGISWTTRTGINHPWNGITYGNGVFAAFSSGLGTGGYVMISPDGINWTDRGQPAGNIHFRASVYGNGIFLAFGTAYGGGVIKSGKTLSTVKFGETIPVEVGSSWKVNSFLSQGMGYAGICYGNGLFMAGSVGDRKSVV